MICIIRHDLVIITLAGFMTASENATMENSFIYAAILRFMRDAASGHATIKCRQLYGLDAPPYRDTLLILSLYLLR